MRRAAGAAAVLKPSNAIDVRPGEGAATVDDGFDEHARKALHLQLHSPVEFQACWSYPHRAPFTAMPFIKGAGEPLHVVSEFVGEHRKVVQRPTFGP